MPEPLTYQNTTARLQLPYLYPGQAQKEFTVNEALARLDAVTHPVVLGELSEPPVAPLAGDCWVVGAAPSGLFAGHLDELAFFDGSQWSFVAPPPGMAIYDRSSATIRRFTDGWSDPATIDAPTGGTTVDAEARQAIVALLQALAGLAVLKQG